MAKTPTKLEMLQKINELISACNGLTDKYIDLLQKLDTDTGVSNTDYSTLVTVEPFSAEELSAMNQLINLRE